MRMNCVPSVAFAVSIIIFIEIRLFTASWWEKKTSANELELKKSRFAP